MVHEYYRKKETPSEIIGAIFLFFGLAAAWGWYSNDPTSTALGAICLGAIILLSLSYSIWGIKE